jgi:hypothetical protein
MGSSLFTEPMSNEERAFIKGRYDKDMLQFKKFINFFMIFGLGIPIIFMVIHEVLPRPADWDPEKHPNIFIYVFIIMLLLIVIVGFLGYKVSLSKLWADFEKGEKIVEQATILKKYQDINGNECFFSLGSKVKPQIMVSQKDFDFYEVGDEINIEYACHSKEFFSYF